MLDFLLLHPFFNLLCAFRGGQVLTQGQLADLLDHIATLWIPTAVMLQAFESRACRARSRHALRLYAEDKSWVESESAEPFSFKWICFHLDLRPEAVRAVYLHDKEMTHLRYHHHVRTLKPVG
jgi:hypothetical protein